MLEYETIAPGEFGFMQGPTTPSFAEKHGGLVVSLTFHVAVFMLLQNVYMPVTRNAPQPEPDPIRIELQPLVEEPASISEVELIEPVEVPRELVVEENVATVAESTSEESNQGEPDDRAGRQLAALPRDFILEREARAARSIEEPMAEIGVLLETELVAPVESEDPAEGATPLELDERIQAYLRERARSLNEYNDAVGRQGSDRVAQRLSLARAELEGKRWLETSEGAQEGTIRGFATSDVDQKITEEVFSRYGIQSYTQFFDGTSQSEFGYLSAARTKEATYVRRSGQGLFQVLSIPESAVARLVQLEREALIERGYNPSETRVIEVEFGIASIGRDYDLVVKDLKVAPIAFRP
jgi:hypothetical protein